MPYPSRTDAGADTEPFATLKQAGRAVTLLFASNLRLMKKLEPSPFAWTSQAHPFLPLVEPFHASNQVPFLRLDKPSPSLRLAAPLSEPSPSMIQKKKTKPLLPCVTAEEPTALAFVLMTAFVFVRVVQEPSPMCQHVSNTGSYHIVKYTI